MTAEEMIRHYKIKYNKYTNDYYVIPKKPKISELGLVLAAIGGFIMGGFISVIRRK